METKTSRTYYYARVSSSGQNLESQLKAFHDMGADDNQIIMDKASGKDTDRAGYQYMKQTLLRPGDTIVVTRLDRLSRSKADIRDELLYFRANNIRVKAMDIPTTMMEFEDGFRSSEWILDMVNNILIEVLGTLAEQERLKTKQRQREGLDAMAMDAKGRRISWSKGTHAGRQEIERPDHWREVTGEWLAGKLSAVQAMKALGLRKSTFYKLAKDDGLLELKEGMGK